MKKIVYVDMDGVLVDFESAQQHLPQGTWDEYVGRRDEITGVFGLMKPMPGALEAFALLAGLFDVYVLSTASWGNPTAGPDKLAWVKKYLGAPARKRLILSHHKNLNRGDYLIDDRTANGAGEFRGEHIWFNPGPYKDWDAVMSYLLEKECGTAQAWGDLLQRRERPRKELRICTDGNARYLYNPNEIGIDRLVYSTGAHYDGGDGVMNSSAPTHEMCDIPPDGAVKLEEIDAYEDGSVWFMADVIAWSDGCIESDQHFNHEREPRFAGRIPGQLVELEKRQLSTA